MNNYKLIIMNTEGAHTKLDRSLQPTL